MLDLYKSIGRGYQPELITGTASCKVSLSLAQLDLLRSRWGYKYLTCYQFILVARYLICCTLVGFPIVISHDFNIVMISYLIVGDFGQFCFIHSFKVSVTSLIFSKSDVVS